MRKGIKNWLTGAAIVTAGATGYEARDIKDKINGAVPTGNQSQTTNVPTKVSHQTSREESDTIWADLERSNDAIRRADAKTEEIRDRMEDRRLVDEAKQRTAEWEDSLKSGRKSQMQPTTDTKTR
jgi:hypothetical protein